MAGILDAYLVQLGFTTDLASLRAFQQTLAMAQNTVQRSTSGILGDILKWQTGIVGAFTSLSGAIIGWGAHVANQDQQLRLYANRMMMTQQSARELKTVLDTLGVSLQDIMFDKELNDRAQRLFALQEQFKGMAPDFEKTLKDIRNLEEATTMSASQFWQYAQISIVTTLFKSFGINIEDVQAKSQKFFLELMKDMPAISTGIANVLKPIMVESWEVAKAWGNALLSVVDALVKIVGAFTGDTALQEGTLNFQKMSAAILHVANGMRDFADSVSLTINLISTLIVEINALLHLDFTTAYTTAKDFLAGQRERIEKIASEPTTDPGVARWHLDGSARSPEESRAKDQALASQAKMFAASPLTAMNFMAHPLAWWHEKTAAMDSAQVAGPAGAQDTTKIGEMNDSLHKLVGLLNELTDALGGTGAGVSGGPVGGPPGSFEDILWRVAMQESGNKQFNKDGDPSSGVVTNPKSGALGRMQLMPDTAALYHGDPRDDAQNLAMGTQYLHELFNKYHGDLVKVLATYGGGMDKSGRPTAKGMAYVNDVMAQGQGRGNVTINGGINVHVAGTKSTPEEIGAAIVAAHGQAVKQNWNKPTSSGWDIYPNLVTGQ